MTSLDTLERTTRGLLEWAATGLWQRLILTLAVALIAVLPGLTAMPVTDRDEARFAQASKQMLETGDLIDIRFQEEPRWKKPAGIYWLQAGSATLFGEGAASGIWAYRLPSAVAVILAALVMGWAVRPLIGQRAAVLSGLMLASTILVAAEANIAKTDATLMLTAVIALGALAHLMQGEAGWRTALVFWLAIAVSILIKGPIVPVIVILTLLGFWALRRRAPPVGRLRPLPGIVLVVVLVAPWLIAIWQISDGGFFAESLGKDMGAKLVSGQEKHWGPPGLYTALVWGTMWPWAALLPVALGTLWAARREAWLILLAAWVIPFWIFLEVVPTKLPHYVLPLYPALIAALAWWAATTEETTPRANWTRYASAVVVGLPGIGLALAIIVLPLLLEGRVIWAALPLALAAIVAVWLAIRAALLSRITAQIGASVIAALLLYPAVLHFALPSLTTAFASPRIAAELAIFNACASGPAFSVGYREPSLVFLTETGIDMSGPKAARAALKKDPGALVYVESRWREGLKEDRLPPLIERAEVTYFNYNRGKYETGFVLTRDDPRWEACGN